MTESNQARQSSQLQAMIAELDTQLSGSARGEVVPNARMLVPSATIGPPEAPVPHLTQEYMVKLRQLFGLRWDQAHATLALGTNTDAGYFGPMSDVVGGQSPPFLRRQIVRDFRNWGLPVTKKVANSIASTITANVKLVGGSQGFQNGVEPQIGLVWQVGYGSMNITQSELGVLYVFGAAIAPVSPTS